MELEAARQLLEQKREILARLRSFPREHRLSMLIVQMHDSPPGGWVQAAQDLKELMQNIRMLCGPHSPEDVGQPERTKGTRILLVDECRRSWASLRIALAAADDVIEVVDADTAAGAEELVRARQTDIAVVSMDLPDRSGIELCAWLAANSPKTRSLLISAVDCDVYLAEAYEAGATAFITQRGQVAGLVGRLYRNGSNRLFSPQQMQRILDYQEKVGKRLKKLTARQREVLVLITAGSTNGEIAEALTISKNTVEKHVSAIFDALGVHDRAELLSFILRHKLNVWLPTALWRRAATRK